VGIYHDTYKYDVLTFRDVSGIGLIDSVLINIVTNMNPEVKILDGRSYIIGMEISIAEMSTGEECVSHFFNIIILGRCSASLTDIRDNGSVGEGEHVVSVTL
jgi:hypothetical protein